MFRPNRWPLALTCLALGLLGGLLASQQLIGQPALPAVNPPPLPRDWMSYGPVVKRTLPAVVCIEAQGKAQKAKFEDLDPGFGSGVVIDPAGIVLTNHHVVANTPAVQVTLQDGRKFTSKDIRRDPKTDLAVVRLEAKEPLPFLEFGDSDAMEVGDRVLALGAPFGLTGSVTQGIVSAKSRQNLNLNLYEDFLQIDAAVNPGNSGGPLVNMEGKVIGLTSAIKTRSGGFQGVGLAVSSNLAKSIAAKLVKDGAIRRPYLGVLVGDLDEATAARNGIKTGGGVVVTQVAPKSPGE
jgi:serine protease Do